MKNSLIVIKENIFSKIKKWFKNIFFGKENIQNFEENYEYENPKNNIEELEIESEKYIKAEDGIIEFEDDDEVLEMPFEPEIEFDYSEREKQAFFKLYENIKLGRLDYKTLSFEDVLKIITIMKYENNIRNN